MIISGDFNSWSKKRMAIVEILAKRLNLRPVTFDGNYRVSIFGHNLDHIYYRGLKPLKTDVLEVTSSDHNPMWVTFKLAENG